MYFWCIDFFELNRNAFDQKFFIWYENCKYFQLDESLLDSKNKIQFELNYLNLKIIHYIRMSYEIMMPILV